MARGAREARSSGARAVRRRSTSGGRSVDRVRDGLRRDRRRQSERATAAGRQPPPRHTGARQHAPPSRRGTHRARLLRSAMPARFLAELFTPEVVAAQERYAGRAFPAGRPEDADRLGPDEIAFITERDSFYMASI